ncbi:uncharacterized protein N7496_002505 [Penicillium cataractarum]|uniref:Piwi domain-containing protein n=1 Tax=Penicillium cataractarum TaxID=2100454 RepID=A0A9W9SKD9_9EURO|nr:uncharacterized protein N7496_002505 [Penicillium cataractarum]KAJ5380077.1 hypothetical protein N7496_002505 [Penicillium cataractarum]
MSGSYRGSSGRGGSSRGDLPYRGGRGGGQSGGRGGFQGGGGRSGPPDSGRMLQGDPQPSQSSHKFEDQWIAVSKAPSRPKTGEMATRPAYGTKGKPLVVRANYFDLELNPNIKFHSYIAKITPEPKIKRHLLQIWDHLLAIPKIAKAGGASDKAGELVTVGSLGTVPALTVNIPDGDRDPKVYSVQLTLNDVIDHKGILGRLRDLNERGGVTGEAIMVRLLNILMAAYPGKDSGVVTLGKGSNNKFYWTDRRKQSQELPGGLECLRGYYASVRLAAGRILLNLSVNHSAFYRPGPLENLWEAFLKVYGPDRLLFGRYVKTLRVQCTHLKDDDEKKGKVPRVKTIWGLAERDDGKDELLKPEVPDYGADANNVKFYIDKRKITVAQYFMEKYNIAVTAGLPVVNVGNKARPVYLPMDVLIIPEGRVFRGELSTGQRQGIIGFSCRVPAQNYDSIMDHGLDIVGAKGDKSKDHGIKIDPNMLAVPARILSAPTLKYAKGKQAPAEGQWNLVGRIFNKCAKITRWVGVVLSTSAPPPSDALVDFQKFAEGMKRCGMTVEGLMKDILYVKLDARNHRDHLPKIDNMFTKLKGFNVDLAVIVMPLGMDRVFDHIKWRADTTEGIVTLCCNTRKFFVDKGKNNDQYWANNAMKVNLRLGGVNQALDLPPSSLISAGKTMVVGLDVTHPSPTDPETFPSIASIVASTDKTMGQWPGQVKIQERRVENVVDLAELMKARLHRWKKENKNALPENIVIFRDGVSEGQYEMVLTDELVKVKKGCSVLYSGKQPNITILVGGKRHNTRFFPTKQGDMDRKANCKNGLVVDRVITRPHLWDFYLQAQAPLQGSARSAHYVVIWDEIFINPNMVPLVGRNPADAIQELTHNICYMMGRCTRAISYSTPAFLADRFADRARKYVRAYYYEHQMTRGNVRPPAPGDAVTRLAPNLSETMVYI